MTWIDMSTVHISIVNDNEYHQQVVVQIGEMLSLRLRSKAGLMTIGAAGDFSAFDRLKDVRRKMAEHLQADVV